MNVGLLRNITTGIGIFAAGALFGAVFHKAIKNCCRSFARTLLLQKRKSSVRTLLFGLDSSGKTTILYQLRLSEVVSAIPTIGFNIEKIEYKDKSFEIWDIGGQEKMRKLWHHYYSSANALIYVIDSVDKERLSDSVTELDKLLHAEELKNVPILVLANKQVVLIELPIVDETDRSTAHLMTAGYGRCYVGAQHCCSSGTPPVNLRSAVARSEHVCDKGRRPAGGAGVAQREGFSATAPALISPGARRGRRRQPFWRGTVTRQCGIGRLVGHHAAGAGPEMFCAGGRWRRTGWTGRRRDPSQPGLIRTEPFCGLHSN